MNESAEKIASRIGSLIGFQVFLKNFLEAELYWHILCGLEEPTEESKKRLISLHQAFWLVFLGKEPRAEQVDQAARELVCGVIDLNQLGTISPVLYGKFANWMIREMSLSIRPVFTKHPEALDIYDQFVLRAQHELNTPLGVLSREGGERSG